MPTYGDETLHDRYAREHADHLARLAKMTPEQIAEMELSLHNAMAEVDRLRANACQGGEAVEVVAYHGKDPDGGEGFVGARWPNAFGEDCIVEPLMTVAQHQRILAASVDSQLREAFPLFDEAGLSETEHHCEWSILQERKRLHAVLDALSASGKGVKL